MAEFGALTQAVIDGDGNQVIEMVKGLLDERAEPQQILTDHLIPGMLEVGNLMAEGEYFIPEVLRSAKVMQGALDILEPLLVGDAEHSLGHVILGTVEGDIHDIGKNLVAILLKGNGFTVNDLGVSVPTEKFVDAAQGTDGKVILGMSALITPVLDEMPKVIEALSAAGLRDRVKVMVGGAPVTEDFANSIGADGTADDAAGATKLARQLLG